MKDVNIQISLRLVTASLLFLFLTKSAQAQKDFELKDEFNYEDNIYHLVLSDSGISVKASVWDKKKPVKVSPEKTYTWIAYSRIYQTQGGYDGKLLHGAYISYYIDNKAIKEKGNFTKGVKNGTWSNWHNNGNLKDIYHWKDGQLDGPFTLYDMNGKVHMQGFYSHNQWDGKITYWKNDSIAEVKMYQKGHLQAIPQKSAR